MPLTLSTLVDTRLKQLLGFRARPPGLLPSLYKLELYKVRVAIVLA
jgi:hypothetical protein